MSFVERVKVIVDLAADGARAGLGDLRGELQSTDSRVEQFKVAGNGAFNMVKGAAVGMAAGAGAALIGFAATAVNKFTEAALAADRFANSSGMTTEQSSRWLAVMSRWGVELGDLQDVFNNVAGLIDSSDPVFEQLGVQIARNADGTTDMNGTMMSLIQTLNGIEDPARRAAMSARFFGEEGSRQFSELVAQGADVEEIFAAVSGAQVFSPEEIEKAKLLKERMRELELKAQDLMMQAGERLVPALLEVADAIERIGETAEALQLDDIFSGILQGAQTVGTTLGTVLSPWNTSARQANAEIADAFARSEEAARSFDRANLEGLTTFDQVHAKTLELTGDLHAANVVALEWTETNREVVEVQREVKVTTEATARATDLFEARVADASRAQQRQTDELRRGREEMRRTADATYSLYEAEGALADAIARATEEASSETATMHSVRSSLVDVARAADAQVQAQMALKGQTMETAQGQQAWVLGMLEAASTMAGPMRTETLNHIARVSGVPRDVLTQFQVGMDYDRLRQIEEDLNWTARQRFARIDPSGGQVRYAQGTPHAGHPGGSALVGENGPEVLTLPKGSRVFPASMTPGLTAGASSPSVHVTQNFPRGTSPSDVVRAQRIWARRNGDPIGES